MPVSGVLWTELFGEISASPWNKHLLSSYFVSTNLRLTTSTSVVLSFWKSFHPSGNLRILGWRRSFHGQSLLVLDGLPVETWGKWSALPVLRSMRLDGRNTHTSSLSIQLCPGKHSVKGVSHSHGFCSLLGIALENTALISGTKRNVLWGNLLGPAHHAGQILGLIRKKPLWSLNEIRSSASVSLSVTRD